MSRALTAILVGALLFAPRTASAQQPSDLFTARFQAYLEALRRQAGIPGMSVAMVQDGAIVWETGLGSQDIGNAVPASPDTMYYVGDLTQTLTATLVLQCVEQGTMTLDQSVSVPSSDGTTVQATLRQLLSHTRPADGAFDYSPERFTALTGVVSKCFDDSYRERLVRGIVDRLAMTRTLPGLDVATHQPAEFADDRLASFAELLPEVAKAYQVDDSRHATLSTLPPDGINASVGVVSTVRDLAKFDAALDQGVLLRPETVIDAWSAHVNAKGLSQPMGLGWFSQIVNGQPVVWHFGYTPNASSALLLKLPNRHITFILLANSDGLSARFALASGDVTSSPFAQLILRLLR
jgi:CubicO group peptidase (beta-lactamase class C family)